MFPHGAAGELHKQINQVRVICFQILPNYIGNGIISTAINACGISINLTTNSPAELMQRCV